MGTPYGTWRPRGLSKWVISRVISTLNGVSLIITLLITDLLSPLGLQVWVPPDPTARSMQKLVFLSFGHVGKMSGHLFRAPEVLRKRLVIRGYGSSACCKFFSFLLGSFCKLP